MSERTDSQVIHEARGLCWHEWPWMKGACIHCGFTCAVEERHLPNYDLCPEEYLEAMAWAKEQEWWLDFIYDCNGTCDNIEDIVKVILDPKQGSHTLAKFLEGREG